MESSARTEGRIHAGGTAIAAPRGSRRPAVPARWVVPTIVTILLAVCRLCAAASPVPMRYGYQAGDAFVADRMVTISYHNVRTDERRKSTQSRYTSVDRYRYSQLVSEVDGSGAANRVSRSYRAATSTRQMAGRTVSTEPRRLQGRTFTARRSGDAVQVQPSADLLTEDLRELQESLADEYAAALPNAARAVGDTWPLPVWAARAFYVSSEATGTCRYEAITAYRGAQCARISVVGEVAAVDLDGRHIQLHLTGALLWSLDLGRVVAFSMDATSQTEFTTRQGAAVQDERTTGRMSLHQDYRWTAIAGKPVATH